jgi:hypothetical protein
MNSHYSDDNDEIENCSLSTTNCGTIPLASSSGAAVPSATTVLDEKPIKKLAISINKKKLISKMSNQIFILYLHYLFIFFLNF